MAVYRSDQAQLTFGVETVQGADPEFMAGTAGSVSTTLSAATKAGARSITVASASGALVGDFIRIGTFNISTPADTATEHEVRRIEAIDSNTLTLDRPTGFYHAASQEVKEVTAVGGTAAPNDRSKFISWIPGIYESIDTPDPEMSIEGKYFLNTTSKRNFTTAYAGQQTLTGSVSDIMLLNGWALRFPIGKVTTIPSAVTGSAALSGSDKLNGNANLKGDVYLNLAGSHGFSAGDIIAIYDAANTSNTTKTTEVRKIESFPSTNVAKLNYPLSFDHVVSAYVREQNSATYYTHEIIETTDLDTVSWHVHMKDSAEQSGFEFDRRYVGGMIGSASISAEEGAMVSMSWDGVNFLNMIHNQANQTTVSTNLYNGASVPANMPRFGLMQAIDVDDVGMAKQTHNSANTGIGYPTTKPYYFSEGTIKYFGQEFAKIRSFSISISNGEEARYYIGKQGARARGPYEIREGAREYSMSCSVALPDANKKAAATIGGSGTSGVSQDNATELFKQLLLEGDYGGSGAAGNAGFTATIKFERGASDFIIIDIPTSTTAGSPTAASSGINSQGMFINTAPHSITTDNPFQVDIDAIFRSMKITIRDNEPFYP
tara:strand:+ start:2043 stop:3851 length:1809 start_codon:yes stop_codon:yes gene_type:complete